VAACQAPVIFEIEAAARMPADLEESAVLAARVEARIREPVAPAVLVEAGSRVIAAPAVPAVAFRSFPRLPRGAGESPAQGVLCRETDADAVRILCAHSECTRRQLY
jgi:hypothetical protein